jgi:hypothetical protein
MQLGMASRGIEKETTQNRNHVLSSYWHYLFSISVTHTPTAKSRYAYRLIERLDIIWELDHIIALCCADAFNEQYHLFAHFSDIEPHNKSGSIYFLRFIFEELSQDPLLHNKNTQLNNHFEHGADTKLQYQFKNDYSLILSFSIRDRYIMRDTDFFRLLLDIHIDDFRNGNVDRLDAYTQPLIDDEEGILATIMWHELTR